MTIQSTVLSQAAAVRSGKRTAVEQVGQALKSAAMLQPELNIFTHVLADDALRDAGRIDDRIAAGEDVGPLAGVPIAVKDLFDVAGRVTGAGSKIHLDQPPAREDAVVLNRLKAAGAVCIGLTNMDEYAYGFTTENSHYGTTRNPRNPEHIAGGSSGGSAAAVAAGIVPFSLGSDTNGSIRVPAAFCGLFGLKPTFGRLSRRGVVPFVASLDHVGSFARSTDDLALTYDVMQGVDPADPACSRRAPEPCFPALRDQPMTDPGIFRIATLGGWFKEGATLVALEAVERVAYALGSSRYVELPEAHIARSAAFCISAAEGGNLHLSNLRNRPDDFDPATRDRLLAGALIPAAGVIQAQRFRHWFKRKVDEIFADFDVLLAPSTPCPAPLIGDTMIEIDGKEIPARPNLGIFTQPLSFIGLPVISVPVFMGDGLPLGVQVVTAPWRELTALQVAAYLERAGIAVS